MKTLFNFRLKYKVPKYINYINELMEPLYMYSITMSVINMIDKHVNFALYNERSSLHSIYRHEWNNRMIYENIKVITAYKHIFY